MLPVFSTRWPHDSYSKGGTNYLQYTLLVLINKKGIQKTSVLSVAATGRALHVVHGFLGRSGNLDASQSGKCKRSQWTCS